MSESGKGLWGEVVDFLSHVNDMPGLLRLKQSQPAATAVQYLSLHDRRRMQQVMSRGSPRFLWYGPHISIEVVWVAFRLVLGSGRAGYTLRV